MNNRKDYVGDIRFGLWFNETKKGVKYLTGNVTINDVSYKIRAFQNTYKTEEKQPDYNCYIAENIPVDDENKKKIDVTSNFDVKSDPVNTPSIEGFELPF